MKRKMYWMGNRLFHNDEAADEISEILCDDDFEVELYGIDLYAEHLPKNYTIVDYRSHDTLAICIDGEIFDSQDDIERIEAIDMLIDEFDMKQKEATCVYNFYKEYMSDSSFYQINEDLFDGYLKISNGVVHFKDDEKEISVDMETLE